MLIALHVLKLQHCCGKCVLSVWENISILLLFQSYKCAFFLHCSQGKPFCANFSLFIWNYPYHDYQWHISHSVLMKYKCIWQDLTSYFVLQPASLKPLCKLKQKLNLDKNVTLHIHFTLWHDGKSSKIHIS